MGQDHRHRHAIPVPSGEVDTGWGVVTETDLACPEGVISVCDWGGLGHDELGDLAMAGPGRYRVRVHARNRTVDQERSTETRHLLIWPVTEETPSCLLTPMDEYGRCSVLKRILNGLRLTNWTSPPPLRSCTWRTWSVGPIHRTGRDH